MLHFDASWGGGGRTRSRPCDELVESSHRSLASGQTRDSSFVVRLDLPLRVFDLGVEGSVQCHFEKYLNALLWLTYPGW